MYYCYKIMLQDFQIDTLEAEGINNSGYIRMIYNGNSFFFSHHYLKSNREGFNTIRCFNEQNIIYFVAKKICAGNYLICWIGDGESLELRNNYTPNSIKKEALKTVIICALTSALFYFFNKANSEVISVILICFISLFVPFSLVFLYAFIDSLKSSSRQIKKLLDLDLLHSTGFFVPLDSLERTTECPLLEKLPNELQSLDGIVQSAFRKTKTVHKSSYCATTETSFDDSYTKVMLYITVNDKTHAFEYKEEKSSDALSCTRIPPFVVEGDDVTLYWYQGHLEDIPTDSITGLNGKRLICLYNRTSNTLFKSRQNITPKLPNKIPILGGRGDYNTYRKF